VLLKCVEKIGVMEMCGENRCYGNVWRELVLWKCVEKIGVMGMCGENRCYGNVWRK
jgi:hypothetical protein